MVIREGRILGGVFSLSLEERGDTRFIVLIVIRKSMTGTTGSIPPADFYMGCIHL